MPAVSTTVQLDKCLEQYHITLVQYLGGDPPEPCAFIEPVGGMSIHCSKPGEARKMAALFTKIADELEVKWAERGDYPTWESRYQATEEDLL